MPEFDVDALRAEFPALAREQDGRPVAFLDGPGGTQVPQRVIDAVSGYYRDMNANAGGAFRTSELSDAMVDEAHAAVADFLGAASPDEIKFGYNMSTLTLHIGRSIGATLAAGRRDRRHDPRPRGQRLDLEGDGGRPRRHRPDRGHPRGRRHARPRGPRIEARRRGPGSSRSATRATRSARSTRSREIVARAHEVGALTYVDAVALRAARPDRRPGARHRLPGLLGLQVVRAAPRRAVRQGRGPRPAAGLQGPAGARPVRDRARPAFEAIAGTLAATDYLRDVGRSYGDVTGAPGAAEASERRRELVAGMTAIAAYERGLVDAPDRRPRGDPGRHHPRHHRPGRLRVAGPDRVDLDRGRPSAGRRRGPRTRRDLRLGRRLLRDEPDRAAGQGRGRRRPAPRPGPLQHRGRGRPDARGARPTCADRPGRPIIAACRRPTGRLVGVVLHV